MQRIRVGVLIDRLVAGGAEQLVYEQLGTQVEGVEFELFILRPGGNFASRASRLECPIWQVEQRTPWDMSAVIRLSRLLRKRKLTLLHAHLPRVGAYGRLAGRLASLPTIYTEHSLWCSHRRLNRLVNRLTIGLDEMVVAVSEAVAREIIEFCPRITPRVRVIHNGVDVVRIQHAARNRIETRRSLGLREEDRLLINLANLRPAKDQATLLEAFKLLLPQFKEGLILAVVGRDVGEGTKLKTKAHEIGIANRVRFMGYREDALRLLAAADVFVLSSRFEGLPISLLEAGAVGLPCVVTRVGGVPEVIEDGKDGWLVRSADPHALAEAIREVLLDEEMARARGKALQQKVTHHFSLLTTAHSYADLYREICNNIDRAHKRDKQ